MRFSWVVPPLALETFSSPPKNSARAPHGDTTEEMMRDFKLFMRAVQNHVPEDQWALIWDEYSRLLTEADSGSRQGQS
jgi:hypothetical protein